MGSGNHFQFTQSTELEGLKSLRAEMDDFSYDRHAHEEYSLGLTMSGDQIFNSRGALCHSRPGNIIFLNPDQAHDGHAGEADVLNYVMLYIPIAQLEPLLDCVSQPNSQRFPVMDTIFQDPQLSRSIRKLENMVCRELGSAMAQQQQLLSIAEQIAARAKRLQPVKRVSRPDRLLLRAKEFIHSNLQQDVTLAQISAAANLSKYHFLRMFRTQFGMTPHQYLFNCRINAARRALEEGGGLNEIAMSFGFSDLSHFNRRFKRIYGVTPHQYRVGLHLLPA